MADLAMSSLLIPSGSQCSEDDVLSKKFMFINIEDEHRYTCAKCHGILRKPKQTSCGHRICQSCVNLLLPDESTSVRCPAGEPDCVLITLDEIHPDFSVFRELKKVLFHCQYREEGCQLELTYEKLFDHVIICEYGMRQCPHCKESFSNAKFADHVENCREMSACKFERYGCTHRANKKVIDEHESDLAFHFDFLLAHVSSLNKEKQSLAEELTQIQSNYKSLECKLNECEKHNSELLLKVQELMNSQQLSEQRTVCLEDNLKLHTAQCEKENEKLKSMVAKNEVAVNQLKNAKEQTRPLASTELTGELRKQLDFCRQSIMGHTNRLADFELRFQCIETTNYKGVLIWKIGDYAERKQQAKNGQILSLYSQPFYTSRYGYKMCARVYLNGDGSGKGTHLSLFFVIMQGDYDDLLPWPFRQRVTLSLLDQTNRHHLSESFRPDPSCTSFHKPTSIMNVASGCPKFLSHEVLEAADSPFLRNNYIYVKITVDRSDLPAP